MNPLLKSLATWLGVICVLALFFVIRFQIVQGLFNTITPVAPGICRTIASGLAGPEDLEIDAPHDTIFVSATNRKAALTFTDPQDGLYALKLSDPTAAPVKLAGTPLDFHPHGISLYRGDDGSEMLMVIDHKPTGRQLIEIYAVSFDGDVPKLSQQSAIQGGLLVSPDDLAGIAPDKFYVTNDHVTQNALGRFAEDYLLWPHADVMAFNGTGFRIAAQRIAYPNGILARGGLVYVTASNERRLLVYSSDDFTGALTQIGALSLPAWLDNISIDAAGDLIVAGQEKPGSAQVFAVHLDKQGVPQSYDTIFSDDGHKIKSASAAAIRNGHLFIGSAQDNKMLDCAIK